MPVGLPDLPLPAGPSGSPYLVIHDLRDHQITALHIYFPMSLLIEQLTN